MQRVTENDHVTVTYEGILNNGEVFESSEDTGPLKFQMGTNSVIPGFEKGIIGMTLNDTKTITLKPEDAYGPKKEELIHTVDRKNFGDTEIKPGLVLGMTVEKDGEKHKVPAMVTEIEDNKVTVDFNHPLAGQELTYKVTLQSIDQRSPQDTADCGCGCDSPTSSSCSPGKGCGCGA